MTKGNNQHVLCDSGFWISLYYPLKDPRANEEARALAELIDKCIICIPWPTMYEFLNSKLSKTGGMLEFEKAVNNPNTKLISDSTYKQTALTNLFTAKRNTPNEISLVDEVIKLIIDDHNYRFDYFISVDEDLRNYARSRRIGIP
jgi:hypothetical protein